MAQTWCSQPSATLITATGTALSSIYTSRNTGLTVPVEISFMNTSSRPSSDDASVTARFARTARYIFRPVSATCVSGPSPSRHTTAAILLSSPGAAADILNRSTYGGKS